MSAKSERLREDPGHSRRATAILAAGFVTLVVWEVGARAIQHLQHAEPEQWHQAVRRLRRLRRPGEPVLVAPEWARFIGLFHLDGVVDNELASLPNIDRYRRVWQLSIRGADHRWLAGLEPARSWQFGRVELALFRREASKVVFDFRRELLGRAHVALVAGDRIQDCPRRGERFACEPRRSWQWVGHQLAEVNYRPYGCIYAHPVDHRRLRIEYPAARLGEQLALFTGIHDFANRRRAKAPVALQVFVDDEQVARIDHQNEWDWRRKNVDTARFSGRPHRVRFEISSPLSYARTFCFHAEAQAR